jgi:hypothetical protein
LKKEDRTLNIALADGNFSFVSPLVVKVTMPSLESLTLNGASRAKLGGIQSASTMRLRLSGASRVDGEIKAKDVDLDATGASHVELGGAAQSAKLHATGACSLKLSDLALGSAETTVEGASNVSVKVKDSLTCTVNGASQLRYSGNPKVISKENDVSSSITRVD